MLFLCIRIYFSDNTNFLVDLCNDRNKTLDFKAAKILALVHSDLTGPIQHVTKDGYKYVLNFFITILSLCYNS